MVIMFVKDSQLLRYSYISQSITVMLCMSSLIGVYIHIVTVIIFHLFSSILVLNFEQNHLHGKMAGPGYRIQTQRGMAVNV
jgi:hypothetical protein